MGRKARSWFFKTLASTGFLETYPHFAPVLAGVEVVVQERGSLMAVSPYQRHVRLHVNMHEFERNPAGFRGVLQHEVHHILCRHPTDPAFKQVEEPGIMQAATEMTANEFITEHLPGNPYRIADFEKYGIEPKQSTWERYRILLQAYREGRYTPPQVFGTCCGDDEGAESAPGVWARAAREALERMGGGKSSGPASEEQVAGAEAPRIDWAVQLRRFARGKLERHQTLRRANRLDPHRRRLGELPGWCSRAGRPTLIVSIDTSGSMDKDLFPRIGGELEAISRRADLIIVECDDEIRRVYRYQKELKSVRGRGGTDLRKVFDPDFLAGHRPDGIIYFTDGRGPYPDRDPGVPTLWVLATGDEFPCPWGEKVHMSTRTARSSRARRRRSLSDLAAID